MRTKQYRVELSPEQRTQLLLLTRQGRAPVAHWCAAPVGADFVGRMGDVLDLYAEGTAGPDAARPIVCFDEQPIVLRADAHPGQPCAPGQPARVDYEYV